MRRLVRHVQDDLDRWAEVVRSSRPVRRRGDPIEGLAERQQELNQLAAPYVSSNVTLQNQVREKVNIVGTVCNAAKDSKVVTPNYAVALWRRASGFSHGMRWAHHQSSQTQQIGDTGVNLTGTDPRFLSKMVGISMGIAQYTDWLVSGKAAIRMTWPRASKFDTRLSDRSLASDRSTHNVVRPDDDRHRREPSRREGNRPGRCPPVPDPATGRAPTAGDRGPVTEAGSGSGRRGRAAGHRCGRVAAGRRTRLHRAAAVRLGSRVHADGDRRRADRGAARPAGPAADPKTAAWPFARLCQSFDLSWGDPCPRSSRSV